MFKQVFSSIIELLPSNIKGNVVFIQVSQELKEKLPDEIDYNISRVMVSGDIYHHLVNKYPELQDKFKKSSDSKKVVDLAIFIADYLFLFNIRDYQFFQSIELNALSYDGEHQIINVTLINDETLLESTYEKTDEHDMIKAYDYNVASFNADGSRREILDIEEAKDLAFANKFFVPVEQAREYRTHFDEYKTFLNENVVKAQLRNEDMVTVDNIFTPPFVLTDLEFFIRDTREEEIALIFSREKEPIKLTGKLDNVLKELSGVIGASEEVIMSSSLYDALTSYLFEVRNILYDKGIIIKRLNDEYIAYYIHIENDKIIGTSQKLNANDIQVILDNNLGNENIEGLQVFFQRGLSR